MKNMKPLFSKEPSNHNPNSQVPDRLERVVMPLHRKLLLTFLPASLLPIVIAGCISGVLTYQRASQQAELRLSNLATETAELTSKDLESKMALLTSLAKNPLILATVQADTQLVEAANLHRLPLEEVESQFEETKLLKVNPAINHYLQDVADIGDFAEVFFTDRYGFNVAYSQPTSDFVQSDEQWWRNGRLKQQWIGIPKFDQSTQKVTIEIIQAIVEPRSGEFLGIFKGGYDASHLEYLKKDLQHLKLVGSEQAQILAVGNQVTAIATINTDGITSLQDILGEEGILQRVKQLRAAPVDTSANSSPIQTVAWVEGSRRYTLATIPETDWVVVTSVKISQVQASGHQLAMIFGLFFLSLGVLSTAVILRFSQTLSAPLKNLSATAQKATTESDFSIRFETRNRDEVGVLAATFNQLMQRVESLLQAQADSQQKLELYNQSLEKKVLERTQELANYSQTLEQKVLERTQALNEKTICLENTLNQLQKTQSQMIQAEKMSSLGQLVAGIAHEINNPVNFINGNITYIDDYVFSLIEILKLYQKEYPHCSKELADKVQDSDLEFISDDLPKLIASMQVGTERIVEIVKSLRIFSRLDESEIKAVNIHDGLDSTLMILRHRLKETTHRGAIKVIKNYGQVPLVECYGGQLNQVFMNILANAIDVLEERPSQKGHESLYGQASQITISTTMVNAGWVQIAIADNGPGIPEAIKNRIFDPFFTTKPVGKGTGMGMSISYQIIAEKHKGTLDCFSLPNQGTEFVITIPIQQSKPAYLMGTEPAAQVGSPS